jgi:hypothetical protein
MQAATVFIGSSHEHLKTAHALKTCLSSFADATVWDEAAFDLNESIFGGLLQAADSYDFGVFVFDADDVAVIRDNKTPTVRDNVLFELGLFIGRMGRDRAFWISSQGAMQPHIPTDLAGITHLSYLRPNNDDASTLRTALAKACERLQIAIDKLGPRRDRTVEHLDGVRILCAASTEYSAPRFAEDIANIRRNFPSGSVKSAHGVDGETLMADLSSEKWDIVHLAMYVDPANGDLLIPSSKGDAGAKVKRMPMEGVAGLIDMAGAKLVVVVTCDSLLLAARIARMTNTIAGYMAIDARAALDWSSVFYRFLAQGCPLFEAFNRAQTLTNPGLLLLANRDFRLSRPLRASPQDERLPPSSPDSPQKQLGESGSSSGVT